MFAVGPAKIVQVTYRRSMPMTDCGQPGWPAGIVVLVMGAKHTGETPAGRGPDAMYSLALLGTLPFKTVSLSRKYATVPSPGCRGSPLPPQTAVASVDPSGTQGRDQVKPPFVERLTKMPLVSFRRSKWRSA